MATKKHATLYAPIYLRDKFTRAQQTLQKTEFPQSNRKVNELEI